MDIICSICIENIKFDNNCIITECGHHFHTACLLKNIRVNNFCCPYCRAEMVEQSHDMVETIDEIEEVYFTWIVRKIGGDLFIEYKKWVTNEMLKYVYQILTAVNVCFIFTLLYIRSTRTLSYNQIFNIWCGLYAINFISMMSLLSDLEYPTTYKELYHIFEYKYYQCFIFYFMHFFVVTTLMSNLVITNAN